ncbi:cation:proton antiporter [Litorimonas sp. WD9-15]|uniref:cation:proton antiporter n=1 Tax=Litorimonas sp. WD9-15 TaxID=3418716 RepID=UPI003D007EC8
MDAIILENKTAFYYSLIGLSLLVMSIRPALKNKRFINVPILYILVGVLMAGIGLPLITPSSGELAVLVIERVSEIIVIISLAGAGLAIDVGTNWRRWIPSWCLIGIAMPLTIAAIFLLGWQVAGLGIAASVLLGAALAPTDPVLARAVQVGGPGKKQDGARVALTSEAGLNDGLAFPFVWLAIGLAGVASVSDFDWTQWVLYDAIYRTVAGILVGIACGWLITKVLFGPLGDATNERGNPVIVLLSATFIAYGFAEFVHGYGFLSVFVAARAGLVFAQNTSAEPYEHMAHNSADQIEAVLMAILLLWFGAYIGAELWSQWTWTDLIITLAIIFIVRPVIAFLSMIRTCGTWHDRLKVSFFGIRGMGSIFYIAYAQSHAEIEGIDAVWRIAGLTILISILVHGTLADHFMELGETSANEKTAS